MNTSEPQWYAVYIRSRHEKTVTAKLEEKKIEVLLPLRKVLRRWDPLQGVTGILLEKRKQHLLVLSVDLLQQSASLQVDISNTDVAKI